MGTQLPKNHSDHRFYSAMIGFRYFDEMTTAHLLCGLPGSGKTTLALDLEKEHGAVRYTYDAWMVQLFGRSPPADQFEALYSRVAGLIWRNAARNLELGMDVVLDAGFSHLEDRVTVKQAVSNVGAASRLYLLEAPVDVMRSRVLRRTEVDEESLWINADAFSKFLDQFERPSQAEGFELIRTG